jgi:hypothetical protein
LTSGPAIKAQTVFWAVGKHEVKRVDRRHGRENRLLAFKRHLRLEDEVAASFNGSLEVHLFAGAYGGLSPIENDLLNYCCVVDKALLAQIGHRWERLLAHQCTGNPRLSQVLKAAHWQWQRPLAMPVIPYSYMYDGGADDMFRLGDQFAVTPSLTGDGMAMALLSAATAARHYHQAQW